MERETGGYLFPPAFNIIIQYSTFNIIQQTISLQVGFPIWLILPVGKEQHPIQSWGISRDETEPEQPIYYISLALTSGLNWT